MKTQYTQPDSNGQGAGAPCVCVHEHMKRVDPLAHVCMCVHRRGLYVTHVCVACLLACGACLPHRRCDPIAGQGRRSRQSQVVEVLRVEI